MTAGRGAFRSVLFVATAAALTGCSQGLSPWLGATRGSTGDLAATLDGVTQTTPLIVGTVVDPAGRPAARARVRIYEGLIIRLDGVTQTTPLDGVTQTTPLDGVTQTTPLDGVTQTTPLDGVTQTTPLDGVTQTTPLDGVTQTTPLDGVTQTTPMDGVTQTTPLDGVTQTTPLDGVTQTTPFDGVTQTTPFDGVTQTTPLQAVGEADAAGRFAIPAPGRRVLAVEAAGGGLIAARLGVVAGAAAARIDVGTLWLDRPGKAVGRVVGPPAGELAGIAVFVPGTDLVARTDASGSYRIADLPAGTVRVAAVKPKFRPAVAAGIAIKPGATAAVPDLRLLPEKPRLLRLEPPNGGPGAAVRLVGEDFGAASLAPVAVRFGSLAAAVASRVDAGAVLTEVPAGATSGPVTLLVDGVPSNPVDFTVIATLSVNPARARDVPGKPIALTLEARDAAGRPIANPVVAWSVVPDDLGAISAGSFTAGREGYGQVLARSGALSAAADLGFGRWRASLVLGEGKPRIGPHVGASDSVAVRYPTELAALPDGSLLFTDLDARPGPDGRDAVPVIRKLWPDGQVTLAAGTGDPGQDGDGQSLAASRLLYATSLAVSSAGAVAFVDERRIRGWVAAPTTVLGRSLLAGQLWDLAVGNGSLDHHLAWGPDRDLFLTERWRSSAVIRRIAADGGNEVLIRTGPDRFPDTPDVEADPAQIQANLANLVVDGHGNLLIATGVRVWLYCRKAGTYFGVPFLHGELKAVAGTGEYGFDREEGPALATRLWGVAGLAFLGDDLLMAEHSSNRVRLLEASGKIRTLCGGGPVSTTGPEKPDIQGGSLAMPLPRLAGDVWLNQPSRLTVGPDGSVYVSDRLNHRILKLVKTVPD
ncbi:MAG: DUF4573 domain-containing protein [Candidatus Sericytochromatia bacterium]|nr:DUF4573 domain-containing protein [Candidatus Tanganyikabacteria bacterium]